MNMQNTLIMVSLLALSTDMPAADDGYPFHPDTQYLVQLKEIALEAEASAPPDQSRRAPLSVETPVSPGKEFYVRSVIDGFETLFRGKLDLTGSRSRFKVEYLYRRADLGDNPPPPTTLEGTVDVNFQEPIHLTPDKRHPGADSGTQYALSIEHFHPVVGILYMHPRWSVRLVDEAGQPVANAQAGLCDDKWELMFGPFTRSDTNGVIRIGDGRELLPLYTFVAEHRERDLFAIANFDRNRADKTFTVTMRKGPEKPKGFEMQHVFK